MSDELGLGKFFEFCNNDAGFNSFLKGFNYYVEGDIKIEDLFSVDFLFKGKLDNCVVTNTYLTNQFLYQMLKLYSIATVNSTKVVCKHFGSISDICSGISMKSFIGNKPQRKKLVFKAAGSQKWNFSNFFSYLWKGLQISLLTSPQPPQTLSLSQIMQEDVILAYYAQIWKFGPRLPKMEFFKIFSFLWKGLQISLLTQPPPDVKFKSSYARKCDFGLLCPNMEIQPQAPKNGIFQNFFIFVERSPDFASKELSTTCRHKV